MSPYLRALAIWVSVILPASLGAAVVLLPVPSETAFPDATAPDALQYACAPNIEELAAFFERRELPISESLVAPREGHAACHIYYEPTVRGFRAAPESYPVSGLFVAVDPMSFVVTRKPTGDSLSIAKQVLPLIDRPLDVTISVAGNFDSKYWPQSLRQHFSESKHRLRVRQSGAQTSHPWAQDHQKAGEVDGRLRILVPRRLFEGRREDGEAFGPMLDKLSDPVYARSKISWEGGDIQFVRDPRAPSRLVIVHGGVGRYYWGMGLTGPEASYVLLIEFGADLAVDLTPTTVHADFVAAFLPQDGIALVSQGVSNDAGLFRSGAEALARLCGKYPPPALLDMQRFLAEWDGDLAASAGPLRGLLHGLEKAFSTFTLTDDPVVEAELTAYVDAHCGGDAETCFTGDAKNKMQELVPDLLRRSTEQSTDLVLLELGAERILAIMEAQLPREQAIRERAMDGAARTFEEMGFRVIRVPYLYSPRLHDSWPGVAYVNSFVDGRKVFVPGFGLGSYEAALFARLQEQVGPNYQTIPINAWSALLNNGGAHCVFGIIREPPTLGIVTE